MYKLTVVGRGINVVLPNDTPLTLIAPVAPGFEEFFDAEVAGQVERATILLRSTEAANDVVQDAFIGVLRRWGSLEHPGSYLNRSVLNGCRDQARREVRTRRLLPRLIERGQNKPHDPLDDVLARLPFNHRAALVLKYWGGLSTKEIAEQLDCSPGSVGPWIDRALKKLRKELS